MKEIQINDKFKNIFGEVREIIRISPTGLVLTIKNLQTDEIEKFRFYQASGKYIKQNSVNTELGNLI